MKKSKKKQKKKRISKNTGYQKGRRFEYRVKKHFEDLGYYVIRQYASKGAQDLTAIKKAVGLYTSPEIINGPKPLRPIVSSEVLFIQCKNHEVERPLSKREKDNLLALTKYTGGIPLLAENINHKIRITEVFY